LQGVYFLKKILKELECWFVGIGKYRIINLKCWLTASKLPAAKTVFRVLTQESAGYEVKDIRLS
jgi:hypothetical protein